MRILATADLHGHHAVYAWLVSAAGARQPDLVVLAGDLLGDPDGFDTLEEAQRADRERVLEHLAGLEMPALYLMGNDDWIDLDVNTDDLQSIHGRRIDYGAFNFVGYQYTLPFMGGINEKPEDQIDVDLAAIEHLIDERSILVTHGPALGILDRGVLNRHAGSKSLLDLMARRPFLAHIHGHIHREFGRTDRHFNVASAGKKRAMLIDVETMAHEVLDESD